jgi:hypothetical protein
MKEKVKIVVTVPVAGADSLRNAIGQAGAGAIGNYDSCSFSSRGIGRFRPLKGANPSIGEINNLEEVEEERIEITCSKETLNDVILAIKKAHPYEEPAIDIYPLSNSN